MNFARMILPFLRPKLKIAITIQTTQRENKEERERVNE